MKLAESKATLEWLKSLHQEGIIDDTDFKEEKGKIFAALRS